MRLRANTRFAIFFTFLPNLASSSSCRDDAKKFKNRPSREKLERAVVEKSSLLSSTPSRCASQVGQVVENF